MAAERSALTHHLVFAVLCLSLIALGGRLFAFQQTHHDAMVRRAAIQQRMTVKIPARRGNIYGRSYRRYELLAASHQSPGCFADPMIIGAEDFREVSDALAAALGLEADTIHQRLVTRRSRRFVWVKRDLTDAEVQRIRDLDLTGVGIQRQWRRRYPNGSLAAHVVGFAGVDGAGLEGVEKAAEQYLAGVDGANEMLTDAARRPIWNKPEAYTAPVDGDHLYLTIDVVIQRRLEEALAEAVTKFAAESALGVVVDPSSGEILAMANVPTYDLNAFGRSESDHRRNRAVADMYEPGSIFKPFIASVALADGVVNWGEEIFCYNGAYRCRRGRTLHDAHPYGKLSIEAVVYKSSNIGMARIGERLGNRRLYEAVKAFGFGRRTGIELTGEVTGQINPLRTWRRDSTWSVPMGQEVAVTGLQVTMAFAALANEGLLLQPKLIRKIVSPDGSVVLDNDEPTVVGRVLGPELCRRFITDVLGRVPTDGTGRNHARLDGWSSFGKTGTAQIAPYSAGQFTASYIAGAPLAKPRLVCLVSVRKPDRSIGHYGGTVAGPVVKDVLEQALAYLNVPKDDER